MAGSLSSSYQIFRGNGIGRHQHRPYTLRLVSKSPRYPLSCHARRLRTGQKSLPNAPLALNEPLPTQSQSLTPNSSCTCHDWQHFPAQNRDDLFKAWAEDCTCVIWNAPSLMGWQSLCCSCKKMPIIHLTTCIVVFIVFVCATIELGLTRYQLDHCKTHECQIRNGSLCFCSAWTLILLAVDASLWAYG